MQKKKQWRVKAGLVESLPTAVNVDFKMEFLRYEKTKPDYSYTKLGGSTKFPTTPIGYFFTYHLLINSDISLRAAKLNPIKRKGLSFAIKRFICSSKYHN